MAKYTMLLAEYLERGGALPSSFSQIQGFEDAFIAEYCDSELGYETPNLFSIKLEAKANLIMKVYKEKIDERAIYWTKLRNPTKVYYEKATTKYDMGPTKGKSTQLPFDAEDAEPNIINEADAVHNEDVRETRKEDNGETIDEVMRVLDYLNKEVNTLVQKCLAEFKTLFMQVY